MTARTPELVSEFDPQDSASVYRLWAAIRSAEGELRSKIDQALLLHQASVDVCRSIAAATRLIVSAITQNGAIHPPDRDRDTSEKTIRRLISNTMPWLQLPDPGVTQPETKKRLEDKWKAAFGDPDKDPEVVKKYAATLRMLRGSQPG